MPKTLDITRILREQKEQLRAGFQDRLVMTASICLRKRGATQLHLSYGVKCNVARRVCSSNPLRIPHPKIDKLAVACAGCGYIRHRRNMPPCLVQCCSFRQRRNNLCFTLLFYHTPKEMSRGFQKEKHTLSLFIIDNSAQV